tara:strand:+ start:203 stop:832 length:630 start_codon:yes stop_codon:yes gene_type:complete
MTTKLIDIIVIGTGGLAREFTTYFSKEVNILGYSTTTPQDFKQFKLKGELFPSDLYLKELPTANIVIPIGNPKVKKILHQELSAKGFKFPSIIHNSAIVSQSSVIGDGVVISPLTVIGPNTNLKDLVYCNYHVGIGHDSQIGEYTQINSGVQIGGGVIIHSESLIGSNSTLLQSTSLNAPITIGSGSIVIGKKNKSGTIAPNYSRYLPF